MYFDMFDPLHKCARLKEQAKEVHEQMKDGALQEAEEN